jgi:hypothetical protein
LLFLWDDHLVRIKAVPGIKSETAFILPRWSSQRKSNLAFMKPFFKYNGAVNIGQNRRQIQKRFVEHLKMENHKIPPLLNTC